MCEIFMALGKEALSEQIVGEIAKAMLKASPTNADGFGYFNEYKYLKSGEKFNESNLEKFIEHNKGRKFLVSHCRLATHGEICKENSHPFVKENLILVHNGVIYTDETDVKGRVDSEILLEKISKAKGKDVATKIKNTLENDVRGSLSCFLYDSFKEKLYYFRDGSSFLFGYIPELNVIIGMTDGKKLGKMFIENVFSVFKERKYKILFFEPKEYRIYEISSKGIKVVKEWKEPYKAPIISNYRSQRGFDGYAY